MSTSAHKRRTRHYRKENPRQTAHAPTVNKKSSNKKYFKMPHQTKWDGQLHFPEYNVLVSTSLNQVEVFSLGSEKPSSGPLHALVRPEEAKLLNDLGILPNTSSIKKLHVIRETVLIDDEVNNVKREVRVKIIFCPRMRGRTLPDCGTHPGRGSESLFSLECLSECMVFDPEASDESLSADDKVEVVLLLGEGASQGDDYFLLAGRLLSSQFKTPYKTDPKGLFEFLRGRCSRGGFEAKRSCGALGRPEITHDFFSFFHHPGNLPRTLKGTRFFVHPLGKCWVVLYVSTKESVRRVVNFKYMPPKQGGAFNLRNASGVKYLEELPAMTAFSWSRPYMAMVLDAVNKQVLAPSNHPPCVSKTVNFEIKQVKKCISDCRAEHSYCDNIFTKFILRWTQEREYSLVQYPVGYHVDTFKGGRTAGLENKAVYCHPGRGTLDPNALAEGRGGAGPGRYAFALLDW
jgi:hypothetical protein